MSVTTSLTQEVIDMLIDIDAQVKHVIESSEHTRASIMAILKGPHNREQLLGTLQGGYADFAEATERSNRNIRNTVEEIKSSLKK